MLKQYNEYSLLENYKHFWSNETFLYIGAFLLVSLLVFFIIGFLIPNLTNNKDKDHPPNIIGLMVIIVYAAIFFNVLFFSLLGYGPLNNFGKKYDTWIEVEFEPYLDTLPVVENDNIHINDIDLGTGKVADFTFLTTLKVDGNYIREDITSYEEDLSGDAKPFVTYKILDEPYGIKGEGIYDMNLHLPSGYIDEMLGVKNED